MVQPSRRALLRSAVVVAAAAGPLALAERAVAAVLPTRLARSTFTPLVGSTFRLLRGGQSYRAKLSSVDDLAGGRAGSERQFRLLFTVHGAPAAGTHQLRHAGLGRLPLFVAPVGAERGFYEAVVNCL